MKKIFLVLIYNDLSNESIFLLSHKARVILLKKFCLYTTVAAKHLVYTLYKRKFLSLCDHFSPGRRQTFSLLPLTNKMVLVTARLIAILLLGAEGATI